MEDIGLKLKITQIASFTKYQFKKKINTLCQSAAFNYLLKLKSKQSKGKEIIYSKLNIQNYLRPGNGLMVDDMRKIFLIRSQNLQVKCNFSKQFSNKKCELVQCNGEDSQIHLFNCEFIEDNSIASIASSQLKYEDIFTQNVTNQNSVMRILMYRYERRLQLLSPKPVEGEPVDRSASAS